jgi:tetratricopeptide (TPR) repeat protein
MRQLISWQLSILLLAGMAAGAQVPNSSQNGQSPGSPPEKNTTPPDASQVPTTQPTITPGLTVNSSVPHAEPPLPKLAPDQFTECYATNNIQGSASVTSIGEQGINWAGMMNCQVELARDTRIVIAKCTNRDGKSAPPVAIQACTELLDRKLLEGHDRFYPFVNRAKAYFVQGDKQHALDDYNTAIKVAPKKAQPYYYRAVFYTLQTDGAAALRDLDTALSIDPQFVLALRQRAIIYLTEMDLSRALADFSEAVRLQPKTAELWSERGYVRLLQRDYESAVNDEAEAIRLDPKLARAYFLRGAAFGDLGNSPSAVSDITTAVGLDPSLDHFVSTKGKTASIALPPL